MSVRDQLSRQYRRVMETLKFYRHESGLPGYVPRGHFYSPLPDAGASSSNQEVKAGAELAGINLNDEVQHATLLRILELATEFDWTEEPQGERRFYLKQGYFKWSDSFALFAMLQLNRPQRVIEVGSGFSSALMLDINERFFANEIRFTFVEPFPDRLFELLRPGDRAVIEVFKKPVQEVPLTAFRELAENDVLFIDSSHVAKFGSDVNYLYFQVLPRLQPGVLVHVHDIFWPFEYPEEGIREGHAWNEAYLLRTFLSFNANFEILFWVPYAAQRWWDVIAPRMPQYFENTGASIWLRRVR